MSLASGSRLGPYEIVAPLGAGGMGEVYRARDPRLGREVAIKVLPAEVAADPERLRRFEQEARSASAINHPNILTLFDVGELEGKPYLVMELLEGRTLREIVAGGESIATRRVLDWGAQIARGLAAAHEKSIVHRDLKPENLFLTRDGVIKILDFGLAKLTAPDERALAAATTIAGAATGSGVILGTAGYMAPEQVRGERVDARADLFALGCVLYELLGGRRAFGGDTAIETLHAILKVEPPALSELRAANSPALSRLVERCLAKDPAERFQSARDLAFDLENLASESGRSTLPAGLRPGRSRALLRRVGGPLLLLAALAVGALLGRFGSRPASAPPVRLRYLTSSGHDSQPTISPDGRTIAFVSDRDGTRRIWLKQLATGGEAPLTEGMDWWPRFLPDGESILFTRQDGARVTLYRTALVGGQSRRVIDDAQDGDVSPDGRRIAFIRPHLEGQESSTSLMLAEIDGTGVRELLRAGAGDVLRLPHFSPDGKLLGVARGGEGGSQGEFRLVDLEGRLVQSIPALLSNVALSNMAWLEGGKSFLYMQASSTTGATGISEGRLVRCERSSGRSTTVLWSPVNGDRVEVAGPGRVLFDGNLPRENLHIVSLGSGREGEGGRWLSRGLSIDRQPVYSPDGKRVVFSSNRSQNLDLWELDLGTGASRPLTEDPGDDWDPALSPDGKRLLWGSNRSGSFEIWIADADGSHPRQVTHDGDAENPTETPDGQWIVYVSGFPAHSGLWKIRPDGSQATRLLAGHALNPELSPDGQLVAYRVDNATPLAKVRVLRTADGSPVPFEIQVRNDSGQAGRARWLPGARRLAFVGTDPEGVQGVFVQDFVPGVETSASRRRLGGFDRESPSESFGLAPDGSSMVYAGIEQLSSVLLAENVSGIDSPEREKR